MLKMEDGYSDYDKLCLNVSYLIILARCELKAYETIGRNFDAINKSCFSHFFGYFQRNALLSLNLQVCKLFSPSTKRNRPVSVCEVIRMAMNQANTEQKKADIRDLKVKLQECCKTVNQLDGLRDKYIAHFDKSMLNNDKREALSVEGYSKLLDTADEVIKKLYYTGGFDTCDEAKKYASSLQGLLDKAM